MIQYDHKCNVINGCNKYNCCTLEYRKGQNTDMLILKYERLDFFNHQIYTEDTKQNYNKDDLKKVFSYFSKTHNATIQIDNVVIYWDCLSEYENRVVTVRDYDGMNYTEAKKSYDKVKKECYAMM